MRYANPIKYLTNATVVDDAIRFVSSDRSKDKENLKSSPSNSNGDDKEESKEPDYDNEDQDQLEEGQEEEVGETITINQVF